MTPTSVPPSVPPPLVSGLPEVPPLDPTLGPAGGASAAMGMGGPPAAPGMELPPAAASTPADEPPAPPPTPAMELPPAPSPLPAPLRTMTSSLPARPTTLLPSVDSRDVVPLAEPGAPLLMGWGSAGVFPTTSIPSEGSPSTTRRSSTLKQALAKLPASIKIPIPLPNRTMGAPLSLLPWHCQKVAEPVAYGN